MTKRVRLKGTPYAAKFTVVKLRDDEKHPVAAPCAIAGACQYGDQSAFHQQYVELCTAVLLARAELLQANAKNIALGTRLRHIKKAHEALTNL